MTREELIDLEVAFTDEWYKEHTGVPTYADAIEWERKRMIAKAVEWLTDNARNYIVSNGGGCWYDSIKLKHAFKKAMEE